MQLAGKDPSLGEGLLGMGLNALVYLPLLGLSTGHLVLKNTVSSMHLSHAGGLQPN